MGLEAHSGERETHEHVLWEKLNERSHPKDKDVDERRILNWILEKSVAIEWTRMISFRMRPSGGGGSCAKCYELLGYKKWGGGSF